MSGALLRVSTIVLGVVLLAAGVYLFLFPRADVATPTDTGPGMILAVVVFLVGVIALGWGARRRPQTS